MTDDELDLVTVFESANATAEMEALAVQALLESDGIPALVAGTPVLPNLPFQVRVPRASERQARARIAESEAAGPAAAEEAERETEG